MYDDQRPKVVRAVNLIGRYPISITIACVMHLIWAVGLGIEPGSINATGLHAVLVLARSPEMAAFIFASVATLAMFGVAFHHPGLRVALILPQQGVLWFSVIGATNAMYLGQFADGVQRAHWFLIVDQIPVVLIAIGHTAALLFIAERGHA